MNTKQTFLTLFLLNIFLFATPQNITIGIENGINFTNIRKELDNQRFRSERGPVTGIFVKYDLGSLFLLQSGINHATYPYSEISYHYYPGGYYPWSSSSFYDPGLSSSKYAPYPYTWTETNYLSFIRIPLLIKFKTHGRLNFEIGGGTYYALLTNDEYRGKDAERYDKEYREENFPPLKDWGWILNSSVTYHINQRWNVFAAGQVSYGRKEYFKAVKGKIGSTELTFGVGYRPFAPSEKKLPNDSLGGWVEILPHTGINISRTRVRDDKDHYHSSAGLSAGVSVKFSLDNNVGLVSGAWYERKGYALNYNGYVNAMYQKPSQDQRENAPQITADVRLDYLTIPFLFTVNFGENIKSDLNFGVYYSLLQNAFAEGERIEKYSHSQGFELTKNYFNQSLDTWFKNSDFGFALAYRLAVPLSPWADIFFSVHQAFGVKNILEDDKETIAGHPFIAHEKMLNNSTTLLVGLSIPVH